MGGTVLSVGFGVVVGQHGQMEAELRSSRAAVDFDQSAVVTDDLSSDETVSNVKVNGVKTDIASFLVKPGDQIEVVESVI